MSSSLINKATKGVFWSAIERFSVQGIQFVLSIIIARLLLPSDYGLIAMLSIFLAVAQSFIDSGFSNALIQKQNRTEIDYSTVFYFNILFACDVTDTIVFFSLYCSFLFRASVMFDYKNSRVECSDKFFWGSAKGKVLNRLKF